MGIQQDIEDGKILNREIRAALEADCPDLLEVFDIGKVFDPDRNSGKADWANTKFTYRSVDDPDSIFSIVTIGGPTARSVSKIGKGLSGMEAGGSQRFFVPENVRELPSESGGGEEIPCADGGWHELLSMEPTDLPQTLNYTTSEFASLMSRMEWIPQAGDASPGM